MASSNESSAMTFGGAGNYAAPAVCSDPESIRNEESSSEGVVGTQTWHSANSPAPTIAISPRIGISPSARSEAGECGGDLAWYESESLAQSAPPVWSTPRGPLSGGRKSPMRVTPIRGMSSAGLATSCVSPEPLLLGTPREPVSS